MSEDRSPGETARQERCARGDAWELARKIYKLKKRKTKLHSIHLLRSGFFPAASTTKPEEREFVVDSGASIHMVSRKDLNSAELDTVKVSKNPTVAMTGNGEVLTKKERQRSMSKYGFIRDTDASRRYTGSSSTRKTLRRSGKNYQLDQWSETKKPQLIEIGRRTECNTANYVPLVILGLSASSSSSSSPTSLTSSSQHPTSRRSESMSDEVRGDSSRGPAETENPNKNDNEEVRGDPTRERPDA